MTFIIIFILNKFIRFKSTEDDEKWQDLTGHIMVKEDME